MIASLLLIPLGDVRAAGPDEQVTEQSFYNYSRAKMWWDTIKTRAELDALRGQLRRAFGYWIPSRRNVEAFKDDPSYDERTAAYDLDILLKLWKQIEAAGVSSWITPFGLIPGAEPTPWGVFSEAECERVSKLNVFYGNCLSMPDWLSSHGRRELDRLVESAKSTK